MIVVFFLVCVLVGTGLGRLLGRWLASRRAARRERIDLLLLLRAPRVIVKEHLLKAAVEAFGREPDKVEERRSGGILWIDGYALVVLPVAEPAMNNLEEMATAISELRMRVTFLEHKAYVIVGCKERPKNTTAQEAYAYVGRLAAALVDGTTSLVYAPGLDLLNLPTPETLEEMRKGKPFDAMQTISFDAIGLVPKDDARMAAAVAEAQARLSEFVEVIRSQKDLDMCLFKAPFSDGTHTEFMWVEPEDVVGESIRGELANEPFQVRGIKKGVAVEVAFADIVDWFCPGPSDRIGPFTEKIVSEKA